MIIIIIIIIIMIIIIIIIIMIIIIIIIIMIIIIIEYAICYMLYEEYANDVSVIPDLVLYDPVESENETVTKLKSIMKENPKREVPCLRRIDRGRLASEIEKIKESLAMIETDNLDELRDLIHAGASLVAE